MVIELKIQNGQKVLLVGVQNVSVAQNWMTKITQNQAWNTADVIVHSDSGSIRILSSENLEMGRRELPEEEVIEKKKSTEKPKPVVTKKKTISRKPKKSGCCD